MQGIMDMLESSLDKYQLSRSQYSELNYASTTLLRFARDSNGWCLDAESIICGTSMHESSHGLSLNGV